MNNIKTALVSVAVAYTAIKALQGATNVVVERIAVDSPSRTRKIKK